MLVRARQERPPCSRLAAAVAADPFPVGKALIEVDFDGTPLRLHFCRPANYAGETFVLLFHGASRTASGYRDSAVGKRDFNWRLVIASERSWPHGS